MLGIKNNMMAENAARQLGLSYDSLGKSIERMMLLAWLFVN